MIEFKLTKEWDDAGKVEPWKDLGCALKNAGIKISSDADKMIEINNVKYPCSHFEEFKEHLEIVIYGEMKLNINNLNICYSDKCFYGYKLIPTVKDGFTRFKVYIYQEGDKELL